ncbi:MAG: hypothetical protein VZS44_09590 [Bacilli bacterium]|nr:hypothetical protein [Bacilli bacterium]
MTNIDKYLKQIKNTIDFNLGVVTEDNQIIDKHLTINKMGEDIKSMAVEQISTKYQDSAMDEDFFETSVAPSLIDIEYTMALLSIYMESYGVKSWFYDYVREKNVVYVYIPNVGLQPANLEEKVEGINHFESALYRY